MRETYVARKCVPPKNSCDVESAFGKIEPQMEADSRRWKSCIVELKAAAIR
jgi:hypothetical protein